MWAALRPIRSHIPSPVLRSGWALKKKITRHQRERRPEAGEDAHRPVMLAG